eukprot:GHVU01112507.1.p1 GENE.GHVU01112507.1~~GHVU01112507.1.p1  ORF type:complete len:509 (-),score=48.99 GHVU01112507.1:1256-2782(-)
MKGKMVMTDRRHLWLDTTRLVGSTPPPKCESFTNWIQGAIPLPDRLLSEHSSRTNEYIQAGPDGSHMNHIPDGLFHFGHAAYFVQEGLYNSVTILQGQPEPRYEEEYQRVVDRMGELPWLTLLDAWQSLFVNHNLTKDRYIAATHFQMTQVNGMVQYLAEQPPLRFDDILDGIVPGLNVRQYGLLREWVMARARIQSFINLLGVSVRVSDSYEPVRLILRHAQMSRGDHRAIQQRFANVGGRVNDIYWARLRALGELSPTVQFPLPISPTHPVSRQSRSPALLPGTGSLLRKRSPEAAPQSTLIRDASRRSSSEFDYGSEVEEIGHIDRGDGGYIRLVASPEYQADKDAIKKEELRQLAATELEENNLPAKKEAEEEKMKQELASQSASADEGPEALGASLSSGQDTEDQRVFTHDQPPPTADTNEGQNENNAIESATPVTVAADLVDIEDLAEGRDGGPRVEIPDHQSSPPAVRLRTRPKVRLPLLLQSTRSYNLFVDRMGTRSMSR